ncbi:MAG: hypothetical protein ACYDDW_05545, partial [Dermatophilaceae bacterium]
VREKAAQLGDAGAAWLSGLPELIADLERRWSVTTGEPLTGGTAAYVAPHAYRQRQGRRRQTLSEYANRRAVMGFGTPST